jgi:hypothetical protein
MNETGSVSTDNHTGPNGSPRPEPEILTKEEINEVLPEAPPLPANAKILTMDGKEMPNAKIPEFEVEKRAQIFFRAAEIVQKQLEHDAQRTVENAIVGNQSMQMRIQMIDHARSLFVAAGHLQMLREPQTPLPKDG